MKADRLFLLKAGAILKSGKIIRSVLIAAVAVIVILIGLFVYSLFGERKKVSYDIADYNQLVENIDCFPALDKLGDYEDYTFKHLHIDRGMFESDGYVLRVSYSDSEFAEVKNVAEEYVYQYTVMNFGKETTERIAQFTVDEFSFKMLSVNEYDLYYPKRIAFIGISESTREIAYVFYCDIDLDYIDEPFEEFLVHECGW